MQNYCTFAAQQITIETSPYIEFPNKDWPTHKLLRRTFFHFVASWMHSNGIELIEDNRGFHG